MGRAALKLLHALQAWPIDVAGRRCLDVGASTGGFTQVLLEHGAAHVTALDVGHDQLAAEVAADPRVTDLPGTNVRDVEAAGPRRRLRPRRRRPQLHLPDRRARAPCAPSCATTATSSCSSSRSSRSDASGSAARVSSRRCTSGDGSSRRWSSAARSSGCSCTVRSPSPIAGGDGNREFLLWLRPARPGAAPSDPDDMLGAIDLEGDQ